MLRFPGLRSALALLLTIYCSVAGTFHLPENINPAGDNLPPALTAILGPVQTRAAQDIRTLNTENFLGVTLDFKVIFWQKTVDYRDGISEAWLVGYQLWSGGKTSFYAISLIDTQGNAILRVPKQPIGAEYPRDDQYQCGFMVELTQGQFALVASAPGGRRSGTEVVVLSVEDTPKLLFDYASPVPDPDSDTNPWPWESTLYFADVDRDGTKEMLIDRDLFLPHDRKEHQQLLFKFDPVASRFSEVTTAYATQLPAWIQAIKAAPSTPRVHQYLGLY